ncbi:DUF664 domain-containing protein [Bremerella cremea]|uniref:DUF664 domain-containing protein n=1 Tax=Bremerella cremea TaxID=1031537 RepID=A0A368KZF5_9BACT|nr:DinB family protein [Bremerella cremea]RCS56186.1 DUF664 domain-containing protein [Bremerella cremea]
MNAVTPILRLHEHRRWTNQHLMAACRLLSEEQLRQQHPIGQGSLWKTLCHMYAAEYVWLKALSGVADALAPGDAPGKLSGNQEGEGAVQTVQELFQRWEELDQRWEDYLGKLTPDQLTETIYKQSSSNPPGKIPATSAMDVLLHVCTHAQYTTAQAVNMLRHSGVESLPPSMLITLAREQAIG